MIARNGKVRRGERRTLIRETVPSLSTSYNFTIYFGNSQKCNGSGVSLKIGEICLLKRGHATGRFAVAGVFRHGLLCCGIRGIRCVFTMPRVIAPLESATVCNPTIPTIVAAQLMPVFAVFRLVLLSRLDDGSPAMGGFDR